MTTTIAICYARTRASLRHVHRIRQDAGQATAEYAIVMLAAAGLAGSALAWAVGTDAIGRLMNTVVDSLISQAS